MAIKDIVAQLEKKDRWQRRDFIKSQLKVMDVNHEAWVFEGPCIVLENIVGRMNRSDGLYFGISAHYDSVSKSPGANDNCSGVAVVLDLIKRLKKDPPSNFGIHFYFFDMEEQGLLGSHNYVRSLDGQMRMDAIGVINIDMAGIGDRLMLWPVRTEDYRPVLRTLDDQSTAYGTKPFRMHYLNGQGSDHESFRGACIDSFTLSAVSAGDIAVFREYLDRFDKGFTGKEFQPEIRKLLASAPFYNNNHKPTDTMAKISETSLRMVSDIIFNAVHAMDKNSYLKYLQDIRSQIKTVPAVNAPL
jgi:hypothetical protein